MIQPAPTASSPNTSRATDGTKNVTLNWPTPPRPSISATTQTMGVRNALRPEEDAPASIACGPCAAGFADPVGR
jgi:hypothetical protein